MITEGVFAGLMKIRASRAALGSWRPCVVQAAVARDKDKKNPQLYLLRVVRKTVIPGLPSAGLEPSH
jgi:hypothetical protein